MEISFNNEGNGIVLLEWEAAMSLKQFNMDDQKIITGLDLGSNSIKCIMAGVKEKGFDVLGFSQMAYNGIQNQQIVDAKAVSSAIRRICQEVEIISERQITDLWVSLPYPFRTFSSEGMAIISGGQVTRKHIVQAIATARAVPLPNHQEVVHLLPVYFKVDRKEQIFNPVGLSGLRLETLVFLVTCHLGAIQDLRKCLKDAGRTARGFAVQPLAGSLSVVSEEDKNQGVCVIDIGKSFSQAGVFLKGRLVYMFQSPCGGDDITGDIVNQLKVSPAQAEQIKMQYGIPPKEDAGKEISLGENLNFTQEQIAQVVSQSLDKSFYQMKEELKSKSLLDQAYNGIVLTGGGSQLKNISQWSRNYFEKASRIGSLLGVSHTLASNASMAGALGLVGYAKDDRMDFKQKSENGLSFRNWFKEMMT